MCVYLMGRCVDAVGCTAHEMQFYLGGSSILQLTVLALGDRAPLERYGLVRSGIMRKG